MRFWRFLRYERPYLAMYAAAFLLTVAAFATDPKSRWEWPTFFYALSLLLTLLVAFLTLRYRINLKAIRRAGDEETEPLSLEAEAYRGLLEQAERERIRAMNEIQARQREHYDFIVSWFHEIKTPIAVLRLMQQTQVDPRSLEEELTKIEQYADQALYYAKLDSFNQDYRIENCDLSQLAKDAVKAHSKTFISKRIKLRLDAEPTIVQTDSKWLLFIVNQLLSNSLKYTGEQGEISIGTRVEGQEKLLVVRDGGIGIDPRDMPRVYNRGFTGENGRLHAKSTGMGLYLAQELSKKLGHYITCESELGRYTEFTVHFPKNNDPYLDTVRRSAKTP